MLEHVHVLARSRLAPWLVDSLERGVFLSTASTPYVETLVRPMRLPGLASYPIQPPWTKRGRLERRSRRGGALQSARNPTWPSRHFDVGPSRWTSPRLSWRVTEGV